MSGKADMAAQAADAAHAASSGADAAAAKAVNMAIANWNDASFWLIAMTFFVMLKHDRLPPGGLAVSAGAAFTALVTGIKHIASLPEQIVIFALASCVFTPIAAIFSRNFDRARFN